MFIQGGLLSVTFCPSRVLQNFRWCDINKNNIKTTKKQQITVIAMCGVLNAYCNKHKKNILMIEINTIQSLFNFTAKNQDGDTNLLWKALFFMTHRFTANQSEELPLSDSLLSLPSFHDKVNKAYV